MDSWEAHREQWSLLTVLHGYKSAGCSSQYSERVWGSWVIVVCLYVYMLVHRSVSSFALGKENCICIWTDSVLKKNRATYFRNSVAINVKSMFIFRSINFLKSLLVKYSSVWVNKNNQEHGAFLNSKTTRHASKSWKTV